MTEIVASLRIISDDLDPEVISAALQVVPALAHKRGDPNIGPSGRRYANYKIGLWSIDSDLERDAPLVEHLESLIHFVDSKRELLAAIARPDWTLDFFVGLFGVPAVSNILIPARISRELGRLNIDLVLNFYES